MTPRTAVPGPGWDGARNLRDLDGLPLLGGGRTQPGQVLRSAAPDHVTARGWRSARAAGLVRVVDLRNDVEKGPSTVPAEIEVVPAPLEDPDNGAYLDEVGPWLDHPAGWAPTLRLFPVLVADAVTAVAGSAGTVLLHCAGGRDRAGLLSALLLTVAGDEPDAVVDDYAGGFRGAAQHPGHGLAWDDLTGAWVERHDAPPAAEELEARIAERLGCPPYASSWPRRTSRRTCSAPGCGLTGCASCARASAAPDREGGELARRWRTGAFRHPPVPRDLRSTYPPPRTEA